MELQVMDNLPATESDELARCEAAIERGRQATIEAAAALRVIRDKKLFRATHKTFEAYCLDRWGFSETHINRLIAHGEVLEDLTPIGVALPANEAQARPIYGLESADRQLVWPVAVETAPGGKLTAAHVEDVVDTFKSLEGDEAERVDALMQKFRKDASAKPDAAKQARGIFTAKTEKGTHNEYYSPDYIASAVREVLGEIDLDPASCEYANRVIRALTFYDEQDNGLEQKWMGRVFLNPPYGKDGAESNQERWSQKLIEAYDAGDVTAAILLVNAYTGNAWFQPLWRFPICFPRRLTFYNEEGNKAPTFPSALVYMGPDESYFRQVFDPRIGIVAKRMEA
jgi:hypothetical protein